MMANFTSVTFLLQGNEETAAWTIRNNAEHAGHHENERYQASDAVQGSVWEVNLSHALSVHHKSKCHGFSM